MALPGAVSSVVALGGAYRVNDALGMAAYDDPGGKIGVLISAVTMLTAQVSYIQTLISAAYGSGITFSGISTTAFSATYGTISNFT